MTNILALLRHAGLQLASSPKALGLALGSFAALVALKTDLPYSPWILIAVGASCIRLADALEHKTQKLLEEGKDDE